MKHLKTFLPAILAVLAALFSGAAHAAEEKEDLLARFDRELLGVMSGFATAREAAASAAFRQEYTTLLNRFVSDANTLQEITVKLGIGEDLNIAVHARNIRSAFQAPGQNTAAAASDSKQKDKKKSTATKANDPLYNLTGQSLGEQTGLGKSTGSGFSQQTPAGFSFRMAGNAVQTLSQLGFGLRNDKYSVSPKYRGILPYLEFKRDVEYFNISYEHFDSLLGNPVWRSDFEKRLKRMVKLAPQLQPVYRKYFPGKTFSVSTEAERLSLVYSKYVEYVKAVEQAEQANGRRSNNTATFEQAQARRNTPPDQGTILREFETASRRLAEFFAEMDSIDWTATPFSATSTKSPAKDSAEGNDNDGIRLSGKSSK